MLVLKITRRAGAGKFQDVADSCALLNSWLWLGERSMVGSEMYVNEDEALLIETVTKFVSDAVHSSARDWESHGIPVDLWASLGELGLLAITTPESHGGADLSLRDLGLVAAHLSKGDLALAWALVRHNQALEILARSGHASLDSYLTGQRRLDWSNDATQARGCDDLVVITETNISLRECARSPESTKPIGARALGSISDASVEPLGHYPNHLDLSGLTAHSGLLAACLGWGLASSALKAATHYALDRQQFGKPIAQFQAIQWKLADGAMLLEAADLLIDQALSNPTPAQAAMAFKASIDALTKIVDDGLQTHGGYGYTEDFDIEKYYRDAQFLAGQMGTRRGQSLQLAQDILNQLRD